MFYRNVMDGHNWNKINSYEFIILSCGLRGTKIGI